MKKQIFERGLLGIPLGIALGHLIALAISYSTGQGIYIPCPPALLATTGSEIGAVAIQTLLCGLLGAVYTSSSVIWELDAWSIAKQSMIYGTITCLATLPVAYILGWMEHSVTGFLVYFGSYAVIFVSIWIIQYSNWQNSLRKLNNKLK